MKCCGDPGERWRGGGYALLRVRGNPLNFIDRVVASRLTSDSDDSDESVPLRLIFFEKAVLHTSRIDTAETDSSEPSDLFRTTVRSAPRCRRGRLASLYVSLYLS